MSGAARKGDGFWTLPGPSLVQPGMSIPELMEAPFGPVLLCHSWGVADLTAMQ